MSSPDVVLILIDPSANILTYPDGTNYTFVTTTLTIPDYPWDKNTDEAAKNASLRTLRDRFGFIINRSRLYDASLVNSLGAKTFVYIYKIDVNERARLASIPTVVFSSINTLPPNLNILSATVANSLTANFNLIRDAPSPANIFQINYPSNIVIYKPAFQIPVLIPYIVYIKSGNQSFQNIHKQDEHIRDAPIVQRTPGTKKSNSPKVPRSIINVSLLSSTESSKAPKEYKPELESVKKHSPKRNSPRRNSPGKIPSPKKNKSKRNRNKKKGGYYLSYIKYKIKYLELKKKLLNEEINNIIY